jgi:hypothetical protein
MPRARHAQRTGRLWLSVSDDVGDGVNVDR